MPKVAKKNLVISIICLKFDLLVTFKTYLDMEKIGDSVLYNLHAFRNFRLLALLMENGQQLLPRVITLYIYLPVTLEKF